MCLGSCVTIGCDAHSVHRHCRAEGSIFTHFFVSSIREALVKSNTGTELINVSGQALRDRFPLTAAIVANIVSYQQVVKYHYREYHVQVCSQCLSLCDGMKRQVVGPKLYLCGSAFS